MPRTGAQVYKSMANVGHKPKSNSAEFKLKSEKAWTRWTDATLTWHLWT